MDDQDMAQDEDALEVDQGAQLETMTPDDPGNHEGEYLQKLRSIENHRQQALSNPDTLMAGVAVVNAELMGVVVYTGEALRHALGQGPITTESIEKNTAPMNFMLRAGKQVAQLSQLELRGSKMEQAAAKMEQAAAKILPQ